MTYKEKTARVKEVIEELGLNKCKHTKIGTWLYRGVSGGERRRCSIALAVCARKRKERGKMKERGKITYSNIYLAS